MFKSGFVLVLHPLLLPTHIVHRGKSRTVTERSVNMDDRHSAILWQLMQSFSTHSQENQHLNNPGGPLHEYNLLSLRPLMPPKQQLIIDLLVKMQELKALMDEIHAHN